MRTHKKSLPVLLTPREVASTLPVDLSTVYRWIDRGTIGAVQFGGARHTVRIPAAELVRLSASPRPAASGPTSPIAGLSRGGLEGKPAPTPVRGTSSSGPCGQPRSSHSSQAISMASLQRASSASSTSGGRRTRRRRRWKRRPIGENGAHWRSDIVSPSLDRPCTREVGRRLSAGASGAAAPVVEAGGHQSMKLQSAVRILRRTAHQSRIGLKRRSV
jgi:excisionase family DNA binding protein